MSKILIEQICVKNINQVPGHSPRLQLDDSNDIPEQSDPLFLGTGSLQNLDLILEPVSQVRLQVDHVSHAPHSPFTKLRFEISAFIDFQNLVRYNIRDILICISFYTWTADHATICCSLVSQGIARPSIHFCGVYCPLVYSCSDSTSNRTLTEYPFIPSTIDLKYQNEEN